MAEDFSKGEGLILICGRYEGVDERVTYDFIDDEVSIGDYVLTGGELAAMVIIEAVTRLIPGTLGGGEEAAQKDSFSNNLFGTCPILQGPGNSDSMRCRKCCFPVTTLKLNNGGWSRH